MTARWQPDEIDLRIIRGRERNLSIAEIAEGLRMPKESVRRRVTRLIAHKLVEPGRAGDRQGKRPQLIARDCLTCQRSFLSTEPVSRRRMCEPCRRATAGVAA